MTSNPRSEWPRSPDIVYNTTISCVDCLQTQNPKTLTDSSCASIPDRYILVLKIVVRVLPSQPGTQDTYDSLEPSVCLVLILKMEEFPSSGSCCSSSESLRGITRIILIVGVVETFFPLPDVFAGLGFAKDGFSSKPLDTFQHPPAMVEVVSW